MKVYFKGWLTVLALALAALVMIILVTQPARAAGPWYVAPGGSDGNDCLSPGAACATINGAIAKASPGDTVYVATGTHTGTGDEVVLLDKDVTLSGGWDASFTTQSGISTIDGEGSRRGITVNGSVSAMVERFTVQNGSAYNGGGIYSDGTVTLNNSTVSGNTGSHMGAGIYNWGNVTLNNSTVSGNTATGNNGGGIYNPGTLILTNSTVSGNATDSAGGGIHNTGTVTLTNSTVSGNTAAMSGGIYNQGTVTLNSSTVSGNTAIAFGWGGGGIYNNEWGTVTLTNSTVSGNTAFNYGGIYNGGRLTLTNSIVSGNTAINIVGGISNDGGTLTLINSAVSDNAGGCGILNDGGTLTLDNSAVSGNTDDGIYNRGTMTLTNSAVSGNTGTGIDSNYGTVTLDNSTVSGNTGGGIYIYAGTLSLNSSTVSGNTTDTEGGGIYNGGTVTLQNTILAGNTASGTGPDCNGNIGSSGYNLIGNTSGCTFTPTDGDLTNTDPLLGPLEGSPGYHPLFPGSPAINAGNPTGCTDHLGNLLLTDQRGMPRVGRCDIGAYEVSLTATKQADGTYTPGTSLTYIITLRNDVDSDITGVFITDTLPLSLTYVPGSFSATNGTGGESGGVITWNGTVPAGSSTTISFRATIGDDVPSCSFITNKALISGGAGYGFEREVMGTTPCVCNLTKHAGNPVLSVGADGTWDDDDVWDPAVLKEGGSYKMWYTG